MKKINPCHKIKTQEGDKMKLVYNGIELADIMTNRSLTIAEALYAYGYDINNPEDMEKAYNDCFPAAYRDDDGNCQIDVDGIEMVY